MPTARAWTSSSRRMIDMDEDEQRKNNIEKFKTMLSKLDALLADMSDESLRTLQGAIEIEIARRAQKRLERF